MRKQRIFRLVSIGVLLCGVVSTFIVCEVLVKRERAELERRTEEETKHIAAQLQTGILSSLEPLRRIGAWWISQGKPLDPEDWASDAQIFLASSSGLREISWIGTDGIQRWSAKPGSSPNVSAVPVSEEMRQLVNAARRRQSAALSRTVELQGGRRGFYACIPAQTLRRVHGYVVGLYDATALVESLSRSRLPQDYRISIAADGRELYSSGRVAQQTEREQGRSADIRLFDQVWTTTASVSVDYFSRFKALVLGLGILLTILLYFSTLLLDISHRRSAELQRTNAALKREINERTRVEAMALELNRDLKRKVAEFQTLLEVIPVGIAVAEDAECRAIWVNPALAGMLGVSPLRNISKTGPDAANLPYKMCRNGKEVPPDELPMQLAATTKAPIIGEEHELVRADGQVLNVLSFASPLFDENGRVRGVLDACINISERKGREQERVRLLEREQAARLDAELALSALFPL